MILLKSLNIPLTWNYISLSLKLTQMIVIYSTNRLKHNDNDYSIKHTRVDRIQKGQVLKAWKEANVVPVYKGGVKPKDDVGSYRPVSLTSILCKVLEKLISVRIIKYADEHDILSDNQFGFWNGRNCEQMLVKFFHHVCKSLDDRKL